MGDLVSGNARRRRDTTDPVQVQLYTSIGIDGGAFTSEAGYFTQDPDGGVCEAFEIAGVDAGGCFCCHCGIVEDEMRGRM